MANVHWVWVFLKKTRNIAKKRLLVLSNAVTYVPGQLLSMVMVFVLKREKLRRYSIEFLKNHPFLKDKLQRFALRRKVSDLAWPVQPEGNFFPEDSFTTPSIQDILNELKSTMADMRKKKSDLNPHLNAHCSWLASNIADNVNNKV